MQSSDRCLEIINDEYVKLYLSKINNRKYKYLKYINIDIYNYILNRYNDSESISESLYRIIHNIEIRPTCKICGKHVNYFSLKLGFKQTCCKECEHILRHNIGLQTSKINDPKTKEKIKLTLLKKYGSEITFNSPIIKEKIQQTNLKKFNSISPFGSKSIQNKSKQTRLKKYGNENYNNNDKSKQTKLERYGDENYNNTEKRVKTCKKKYGGNAPLSNKKILEKVQKTNIKKYGVPFLMQNDELKNKAYKTNIIKYGVPYAWNNEKQKQTMIDKYGVPYAWNNEKQKQTMINKYGVPYAMQSDELKQKQHFHQKENGNCNTSKFEDFVYNKLLMKFDKNDIIRQYKSELYPFNCDFYIQSINLYIEIQGSHFHHFHPYDPNNINDQIELKKLQEKSNNNQYTSIINVWTKSDVIKRNIAKQNNINYLEFFNKNEFLLWFNSI